MFLQQGKEMSNLKTTFNSMCVALISKTKSTLSKAKTGLRFKFNPCICTCIYKPIIKNIQGLNRHICVYEE